MQSKPIWDYIFFGTSLRYLQDAKEGWPVHADGLVLDNIDSFLSCLEEFELPVTQRAAHGVVRLRDELAESDLEHRLTPAEANRLTELMTDVRKTLDAEASGSVAFIVVDKRIDVNKLLSDVRALMAPGTFDALPDIAKNDLVAAGRCIAFELPTAAAFHLLRGTESMLRLFYCSIVKKSRADFMWGPMVKSLRQRKKKPPPKPLLDNLDNIRLSFRNPTQHPDKVYDIQEVQNLFPLCVDVLDRMISFL